MKKQLLLFITLFTFLVGSNLSAQVMLENQAQVDAYAGGATVTGDLIIGNAGYTATDITNLNTLSTITTITGGLDLRSNVVLVNLSGLSNVTSIGTFISSYYSSILTDFSGLEGATTLSGPLYIGNNAALTSITGLDNLTSVGGYLQIANNTNLANLTGLDDLASVGGNLWINDNAALASLTGLENLISVSSGLGVINNPILANLIPLDGIPSLIDGISLVGCPLIKDFTDLLNLTSLEGTVHIKNTGLTSLDGLPNTFTGLYGYLLIENNDDLTDISALASLKTVGSNVDIRENLLLPNLDDLSSLISMDGALIVLNNTALTDLDGLSNLSTIKDYLRIQGNPEIVSLNGLGSVINLGGGLDPAPDPDLRGFIQIDNNIKLTDISGIENIPVGDIQRLTMRNNTLLSTCEISNICAYLPGAGEISGNAAGCADDSEVEAACAALSVSDYLLKEAISIYPNPVLDQLNISVKMEMNIERIELYAMDGRLIKSQQYELQSMDLSNVSTGIYLLKISSDKGQINARIVKE